MERLTPTNPLLNCFDGDTTSAIAMADEWLARPQETAG
jgi:hypothetical protein